MSRQRHSYQTMDSWNPMDEDYHDESFNTYLDGPGSRLEPRLQPCHRRDAAELTIFKLYVGNIPLEIDDDSLMRIFCKYGKVHDVFIAGFPRESRKQTTWGFVEYKSQREAQRAINNVNGAPPLNLLVQFAYTEEEKEQRRIEREWNEPTYNDLFHQEVVPERTTPRFSTPRSMGRGLLPTPPIGPLLPLGNPGKFANSILYDDDSDYYDQYMDFYAGGYQEPLSISVNSSESGRRISMGRSCLRPEEAMLEQLPSRPVGDTMSGSKKPGSYDPRTGVYEYGDNSLPPKLSGPCINCRKDTVSFCADCHEWYCSFECQQEHWPKHKLVCYKLEKNGRQNFRENSNYNQRSLPRTERDQNNYGSRTPRKDRDENNYSDRETNRMRNHNKFSEGEEKRSQGRFGDQEPRRDGGKSNDRGHRRDFGGEKDQNRNREEGRYGDMGQDRNRGQGKFSGDNQERNRDQGKFGNNYQERNRDQGKFGNNYQERNRDQGKFGNNNQERNRQGKFGGDNQERNRDQGKFGSGDQRKGKVQKNIEPPRPLRRPFNTQSANDAQQETKTDDSWETVDSEKPSIPTVTPTENTHVAQAEKTSVETAECQLSDGDLLPRETFTQVMVSIVSGEGNYWVQRADKVEQIAGFTLDLTTGIESAVPVASPEVGKLYACLYEELWFRARVTCLAPTLKVFYVDYGNEEVCSTEDLRILSPELNIISEQAVRITLADGTPEEYTKLAENTTLNVKPITKNLDGSLTVHVEGVEYNTQVAPTVPSQNDTAPSLDEKPLKDDSAPSLDEKPSKKVQFTEPSKPVEAAVEKLKIPPPAVKQLKMETGAICEFAMTIDEDKFNAMLVFEDVIATYQSLVNDFSSEYIEKVADDSFRSSIVGGELVAALSPAFQCWYRAFVTEVGDQIKVIYVDYGNEETVTDVRKLDEKHANLPLLGVTCKITKAHIPNAELKNFLTDGCKYVVEVLKLTGSTAECLFHSEDKQKLANVEIAPLQLPHKVPAASPTTVAAKTSTETPKGVTLRENSHIVIMAFLPPNHVYLRPVEQALEEKFQITLQDVAAHCLSAAPLTSLPEKNDIVASKFLVDNNYYRARVLGVKDASAIRVRYVDFGNIEIVPLERLKPLNEALKKYPPFCVGCSLKNVPELPSPKTVAQYLGELTKQETVLQLVSIDDKKNVELKLMDGTNINEKVAAFFVPQWKKSLEAGDDPADYDGVLDSNYLKFNELEEGKEVEFLCLSQPRPGIIYACLADPVLLNKLHLLQQEINEYCNMIGVKPYTPRKKEVCLAKFTDGEWYRGVALDVQHSTSNILFLDYGNTAEVDRADIRKGIPEFVQLPVVGTLYCVKGCDNMDEKLENRFKELVETNQVYTGKVCENQSIYINGVSDVLEKECPEVPMPNAS